MSLVCKYSYVKIQDFSFVCKQLLQTLTLTVPSKSKIKEVPGVADKKVTVIREVAGMMPSGAYNVGYVFWLY